MYTWTFINLFIMASQLFLKDFSRETQIAFFATIIFACGQYFCMIIVHFYMWMWAIIFLDFFFLDICFSLLTLFSLIKINTKTKQNKNLYKFCWCFKVSKNGQLYSNFHDIINISNMQKKTTFF